MASNYVYAAALGEPVGCSVGPCGRLTVSTSTVGLRYAAYLLTRSEKNLAQKTQIRIHVVHLCALPYCVLPLKSAPTIPNHKGV